MSGNNTYTINVDMNKPENNREVLVFQLDKIPGVGKEAKSTFSGFLIVVPADIRHYHRDTVTEWFKGRVFTDDSVYLQIPAYNFTLLSNRDEIKDRSDKIPNYDIVEEGLDDGRIQYLEQKARREFKSLRLQFPVPVKLSSSDINEGAGDDESLKMFFIPVEYKLGKMEVEIVKEDGFAYDVTVDRKNLVHFAGFVVARTDIRARKKGKTDTTTKKSAGASLLEDDLAAMGLNEGTE